MTFAAAGVNECGRRPRLRRLRRSVEKGVQQAVATITSGRRVGGWARTREGSSGGRGRGRGRRRVGRTETQSIRQATGARRWTLREKMQRAMNACGHVNNKTNLNPENNVRKPLPRSLLKQKRLRLRADWRVRTQRLQPQGSQKSQLEPLHRSRRLPLPRGPIRLWVAKTESSRSPSTRCRGVRAHDS